MRSSPAQVSAIVGAAAAVLLAVSCKGTGVAKFRNGPLTGSFRSTNDKLGHWTLKPAKCVAGHELGFRGVAFQFAAGAPVDDIRIDTSRDGDNVVIVHLRDRAGTAYRVHERECDEITGDIKTTHLVLNKRPMLRLDGHMRFACPTHGLSGEATFHGCLPETVR